MIRVDLISFVKHPEGLEPSAYDLEGRYSTNWIMDAPFSKNNTLLCIVFGKLNRDAQ